MIEASVGHQCPECVAEGRRTQRQVRTAFGGSSAGQRGYVTTTLIAINSVMLVASTISLGSARALFGGAGGGLLGGATPLIAWGGVVGQCQDVRGGPVYPCGVADGEYYRLITAMFLHYGLLHLAMNMYALWILGRTLEAGLGPWRFLALYLLAGLGGNVAAYVFSPGALSAGASTAIFGLFAALFILLRRLGRDTSQIVPILVINLVFTFTAAGVSVPGHVGGLIIGGLVALGLAYAPQKRRTQLQVLTMVATVVLLTAATLWQTAALTSQAGAYSPSSSQSYSSSGLPSGSSGRPPS
jgi:membrane associated rhomboid family serine protease